jgi:hypothetical protein
LGVIAFLSIFLFPTFVLILKVNIAIQILITIVAAFAGTFAAMFKAAGDLGRMDKDKISPYDLYKKIERYQGYFIEKIF